MPAITASVVLLVCAGSASAATVPFSVSVSGISARELGASYRSGCPVGPSGLRLLSLSFIDFSGHIRRGSIVVAAAVVPAVERVFATLYSERFPIRRMRPLAAFGGSDERSMAADNSSGFNCRYAVASGPKRWSAHAYGEAIDVDPLENPYLLGGRVFPAAGRRYLDRARALPGMALPGGTLVAAFARVGWQWGGRWSASPDYQHFSATGG